MKQWLKDVVGNLLGRPLGRLRYMTCPCGHITLSKLPDNSRCDWEAGCDAVMKPLTAPLGGIFPLSDRVIQLQTQLFKSHKSQIQSAETHQAFLQMNDELNELTLFFRSAFPQDLGHKPAGSIVTLAIDRLKQQAGNLAQR